MDKEGQYIGGLVYIKEIYSELTSKVPILTSKWLGFTSKSPKFTSKCLKLTSKCLNLYVNKTLAAWMAK